MFGVPTPGQLELINEKAKRPLSKDEVFVFSSKMVGDKLIDNRFIKLDKSLLEVFRDDAAEGKALMLDHPWAGFGRPKAAYPYGRTFDSILVGGDIEGENGQFMVILIYSSRKEKDGLSTDAIIADIEDGTLFDVSVGFSFSTRECSICGGDISQLQTLPRRVTMTNFCYVIAKAAAVI